MLEHEPLHLHTSLRVGGPADLYAEPLDPDDLVALVAALDADGIPWFIIGGGSNLLVRDGGFRGAAISLKRLDFIEPRPGGIYAGAGVGSRALAGHARERGLTGLEFLAGIPGTLGGALRMNAGAHGSEILDHVGSVEILCDGRLLKIERKALDYGYRCLQLDHNKIIIAAEFRLAPGDREAISATIDGYLEKRRESQRVGFPTAGSFFKNPPGLAAWRLIDEAGLRGRSVGGAQVSEIHANFLVNRGGASAADFEQLAAIVRERVLARSGVLLEDEVRTIGEEKGQDILMSLMKSKRVAVLMGGLSAEREVSLKSGTAVHEALVSRGYDAVAVDVGRDLPEVLKREAVGAAFIALHGRYGEDGCVQGLLELMGIPYTGSGVLASALAMHKFYSKQAFVGRGIPTAPFHCFQRGETVSASELSFGLPLVVKPVQEGSSVGISIVRGEDELEAALELAFRYDDEVLVEQFIAGREVQIGILDDRPIGAIEIVPKNEFYDFEAKYTDGMAEHIFPARLEPELYEKAQRTGLAAHRALGCSGYSRVDLLVTQPGECFVLEVNTLPGMTALSLLPEIAAKGAGLTFGDLVERIIESASLKMKAG